MKLFQSRQHEGKWIAWTESTGWVVFPATSGGWDQRIPCRGLDPVHLRQVPAERAANTGFISAHDYKKAA